MKDVYVLDACALISALTNEKGADVVGNLLQRAVDGEICIMMHKVNFLKFTTTSKKGTMKLQH